MIEEIVLLKAEADEAPDVDHRGGHRLVVNGRWISPFDDPELGALDPKLAACFVHHVVLQRRPPGRPLSYAPPPCGVERRDEECSPSSGRLSRTGVRSVSHNRGPTLIARKSVRIAGLGCPHPAMCGVKTHIVALVAVLSLFAGILGTVGAPRAAASAGYHRCSGKYRTDERLQLRSIRARKVSCKTARAVTRQVSFAIDTQGIRQFRHVFDQEDRRWTCSIRTAYTRRGHDPYGALTCALAGGRRVKANLYS